MISGIVSVNSSAVIGDQAETFCRSELFTASDKCQLDQKRTADDFRARVFAQFDARPHRSAGCQQVIDQQNPVASFHGVGVHFQGVGAVFEFVVKRFRVERKFAWFANRDKSGVQFESQRRGENESASFRRADCRDASVAIFVGELTNDFSKRVRVGEQGSDVAKIDAWLREVGDVADVLFQILHVSRPQS